MPAHARIPWRAPGMREVQQGQTAHLISTVFVFSIILGPVRAFWPAEDTEWSAELVNTSSLCYNASVEDVNPEDPAIWQYTRGPQGSRKSFLQNVHSLLGGSFDSGGLSQV